MSFPSEPVAVPGVVADITAGRPAVPVWVNELGGVTFRIDGGTEYVKVAPLRWAGHLVAEAERLRWAVTYLAVPQVLGAGAGWLHTAGLPGRSAVDPPPQAGGAPSGWPNRALRSGPSGRACGCCTTGCPSPTSRSVPISAN